VLTLAGVGGGLILLAAALGLLTILGLHRRSPWETCEIALSRCDGDGQFYARAERPRGKARMAATSPMFRWPGSSEDLPNDGAVRAAYDVIVQRLGWDGWTPEHGGNGVWWQGRFRRSREADARVAGE
jgi:hypothetical protein